MKAKYYEKLFFNDDLINLNIFDCLGLNFKTYYKFLRMKFVLAEIHIAGT
jgi:hypothetical protein